MSKCYEGFGNKFAMKKGPKHYYNITCVSWLWWKYSESSVGIKNQHFNIEFNSENSLLLITSSNLKILWTFFADCSIIEENVSKGFQNHIKPSLYLVKVILETCFRDSSRSLTGVCHVQFHYWIQFVYFYFRTKWQIYKWSEM